MAKAGPPPFKKFCRAGEWIERLSYLELIRGDDLVRAWIRHPEAMRIGPCATDDTNEIRWQLVLRFDCALTFCRGRFFDRHDFDWSLPSETVYRKLLIELWRSEALFWASRQFGSDEDARAVRAELLKLSQPDRLDQN